MITEDKILENAVTIIDMLVGTGRDGITDLITEMDNSGYFFAPASTRYHMACRGGLAAHSLNVLNVLRNLNIEYSGVLSDESMILIALLHDYDKMYIYQEKRLKNGSLAKTPFEKKDTLPLGHGEKSVMLIMKHIRLTDQEMMCIRWHMGSYDKSFYNMENLIKANYPEVMMVYFSDHISSQFLEKSND